MGKKAFGVGINDYPGTDADLGGCVNDAKAWAAVLKAKFGFASSDIRLLLDKAATRDAVLAGLNWLLSGATKGDVLVFTYSGHGTWVPDMGEKDEEDGRDEALCPYDTDFAKPILVLDDDLRKQFGQLLADVNLTVISDSCHSGTVTRALPGGGWRASQPVRKRDDTAPRIRFLPPPPSYERQIRPAARRAHPVGTIKKRIGYSASGMKEVLLTGADPYQFSYDAYIGGKRQGAMTYYALRALKGLNYQPTYEQWHKQILALLPYNRYPQTPQLEGNSANKRRVVFSSFA